jgi:hypothetical protein
MELTKKQFNEIGPWHFNDLCFDSSDQEFMRRIFNQLPSHLQGLAISWGCHDSVFRDDVFEYLLKKQFDMTYDEYCSSDIGKEFFENGTYQEFNFEKLKPNNVLIDIESEGIITMTDKDGQVKFSTGIEKLDEIISGGYKTGELGLFMAPHGIGKQLYDPSKGRYDEKIQNLIKANKNKDA